MHKGFKDNAYVDPKCYSASLSPQYMGANMKPYIRQRIAWRFLASANHKRYCDA